MYFVTVPVKNAVLVTVRSANRQTLVKVLGGKFMHLIQEWEDLNGNDYYVAEVKVTMTYQIKNGMAHLLCVEPFYFVSLAIPMIRFPVRDLGTGRFRKMELNADTLAAFAICPARVQQSDRPTLTPAEVWDRIESHFQQAA